MRGDQSLPSFEIEKSFLKKVRYIRITSLLLKALKVSIFNNIQGFMTFFTPPFCLLKRRKKKRIQQWHKWAIAATALFLKLMNFFLRKLGGHKNGHVEQNCQLEVKKMLKEER